MNDHPRASLVTARLRLVASHEALAPAAHDYELRNRGHFARWSPPADPALTTLAHHERTMADDAEAFVANVAWRWWLTPLDEPGRIVGTVRFSQVSYGPFRSAMLGYAIDAAHEGRGLMREALAAAIDEVFSPRVNLHRVQANVRPENARSLALLQRLGFEREGLAREYLFIDGAWRDHVLTARRNPDFVRPEGW